MKLYFLRHGKANWPNWDGPDDDRPLTPAGKKEVHAVAQLLVRLKVAPDLILTSPLVRTRQTAAIAAEHLGVKCREEKSLEPGFDLAMLRRLQAQHAGKTLLLVGHEEDFSRVIGSLTNGRIKLAKAGVALIDRAETKQARLRWLLPPKAATA